MSATVTTVATKKGKHQTPILYTGKLTKKDLDTLNQNITNACADVGLAPYRISKKATKKKATKK